MTTKKKWVKVNGHTRAGKKGKNIMCPHCKTVYTVYNFSFSGLYCSRIIQSDIPVLTQLDLNTFKREYLPPKEIGCKRYIDKYDFLVEQTNVV